MSLGCENYRGEIDYCGERFVFMPATLDDVEQLSEMYSDVSITDKNYKVKLDRNHEENYSRCGGVLEAPTRGCIETEIRRGVSCFAVIKTLGGKIIACLRFGTEHPRLLEFLPRTLTGCGSCISSTCVESGENKAVYLRELLFRTGKLHNAAYTLFFTVFSTLRKNGHTHALYALYDLKEYRIGGKKTAIAMLDQTAFDTCDKMGGKFIGNLPEYEIKTGLLKIRVSPKVICLNFANILPKLERKLHDVGIGVFFS